MKVVVSGMMMGPYYATTTKRARERLLFICFSPRLEIGQGEPFSILHRYIFFALLNCTSEVMTRVLSQGRFAMPENALPVCHMRCQNEQVNWVCAGLRNSCLFLKIYFRTALSTLILFVFVSFLSCAAEFSDRKIK